MSTENLNDYPSHESEATLEHGMTLNESDFSDHANENLIEDNHYEDSEHLAEANIHASDENDTDAYSSHSDQASNIETITPADLEAGYYDEQDIETEPEFTAVDIKILNKNYTINCPVGEEAELLDANDFINTFIDDIRSQAPQLGHENLLVLCCLNLYEKLQRAQSETSDSEQGIEQANQLLDQMLEDMQWVKE